jgi:ASC-1-like (ASCH) protein
MKIAPVQRENPLQLKSPAKKTAIKSLTLKKVYIDQIRAGRKTVEGRIFERTAKNLKVGDTIRFYYYTNAQDDVTCKVTKITRYHTFKELLEGKGFKNCIPEAANLNAAVSAYAVIKGYPQKEKKFGVVAIDLKLMNK